MSVSVCGDWVSPSWGHPWDYLGQLASPFSKPFQGLFRAFQRVLDLEWGPLGIPSWPERLCSIPHSVCAHSVCAHQTRPRGSTFFPGEGPHVTGKSQAAPPRTKTLGSRACPADHALTSSLSVTGRAQGQRASCSPPSIFFLLETSWPSGYNRALEDAQAPLKEGQGGQPSDQDLP